MISTCLPTSKSLIPLKHPLVTVLKAPITIGIIVTFKFIFFYFPSKVEVLILLFSFFQFYAVVSRYSRVDYFANFIFVVVVVVVVVVDYYYKV